MLQVRKHLVEVEGGWYGVHDACINMVRVTMTALCVMTPSTIGSVTVVTMGVTVVLRGDQPPAHSRLQRLESRPMLSVSARRPHGGGQP